MTACPSCPAKFDSVVALEFHLNAEHPGAFQLARPLLRQLYRDERNAARVAAAERPGTLHPALEHLYRLGCPCGRSYTAHVRVRHQLGALA